MRGWLIRASWWLRALWRSDQLDASMHEEMRFHIEMEAERLIREDGLDAHDARRKAHVAFGGLEKYKEEGRDTRGCQWIDTLSLDTRLGLRMLVKHRGLTVVGGFAMAIAIAVGATFFEVVSEVLNPALPLEEGQRIVAVQYISSETGDPERGVMPDFIAWRDAIASIEQLAAFRTADHNVVSATGRLEAIKVAEMTGSGFEVARTPPLLGRYLTSIDEHHGASPVLVIGHQVWQSRFGGDPRILGKPITLAGVQHTVVGVMPDGFKFPVDHQFWIPLRTSDNGHEQAQGPALHVFGRLARGATLKMAQAEMTLSSQRIASEDPGAHQRLQPRVLPYTRAHLDLSDPRLIWALRIAQLLIGALSFIVSVNLAILVYARTVARLGEIAVRTALGATRGRILAQLFVEALTLSLVGAGAGLGLAKVALERIQTLVRTNGSVPFWLNFELSVGTAMYALGLALLAALVMGVLPGLQATGSRLHSTLRELTGRSGPRLGPMWTTLVVAQIAVAVALLPVAVFMAWQVVRMEVAGPGFDAGKYVVGMVAFGDTSSVVDANRVKARQLALTSRLQAEPGVSAVTFSSSIPGFAGDRRIRFDNTTLAGQSVPSEVSSLRIGVELFETYGAEILAGRPFSTRDVGKANTVIVNRAFTRKFLENRSALGVQFHYVRARTPAGTPLEESYQVVGVVADFPNFPTGPGADGVATIYHPATPGDVHPVAVSVRFDRGVTTGFVERFREMGAEIDPALQLRRVVILSTFYDELRSLWRHLAWGLGLVTTSVLLLSAAGIYALMSFTVARRTREIGVRSALGARPYELLISIFGRATRQLMLGLLIGSLLSCAICVIAEIPFSRAMSLLLSVAAIMLVVVLLASLGPARRGLRIQASEALRAEA